MGLDPTKKAFSLFDEFKAFAFKGNVIDLAVGVIIGGAFGKIVGSLVENVIMPAVGLLMPGGKGYEDWAVKIGEKVNEAGLTVPAHVIPYGKFIGECVNFVIVAAALFIFIVKFLGWIMKAKKAEAAAPPPPPPPTKEQLLLTEIRDLLAKAK